MNFSDRLKKLRELNWSDIEMAEELSKLTKTSISRQNVYNWRTAVRENPAKFAIGVAILRLYEREVTQKEAK